MVVISNKSPMIKMFLPILFNSARKWGYISQSGEIVIPPKFLYADSFSEGLAPVKTEDGYGYINGAGCFAIPPLFGEAESFEGGLAIVCDNKGSSGKYGMIDKSGKFVIKPAFDSLVLPSWGLSLAAVDNKLGFVDSSGKFRIPPIFDNADSFDECGWSCVEKDGICFFIGVDGKTTLQFDCESATPFYDGLSVIARNGKSGCVDRSGALVMPCVFDEMFNSEEGTFAVKREDAWSFVDWSGTPLFDMSFDLVTPFSEGFAGVCRDDRWGYMAHDGSFLTPLVFPEAWDFCHSFAKVLSVDGEMSYLHSSGKSILPLM
jgi:hypothetical protein